MSFRAPSKIALINPFNRRPHYGAQMGLARLLGKAAPMPSLSLAMLAALTPDDWEVEIIDELDTPIDEAYRGRFDIVGIAALTPTAPRAFELADMFRRRGSTVVLGGPFVTYCIEEALRHADVAVAGEAEESWPRFLRDFRRGAHQRVYRSTGHADLAAIALPRWDLFDTGRYLSMPVQTSRGCPFTCEFCVTSEMFGRVMRFRPIESIARELESLPMRRVFFVDDNLTINRGRARELMDVLRGMDITWICQASIDCTSDEDLLDRMALAGCDQVLIGFESMNARSLHETGKNATSPERYANAIDRIQSRGMHVLASFIVGFDHDTRAEFDRILELCERTGVLYANINLLSAPAGSRLHDRLCREGRVRDIPLDLRGGMMPVVRHPSLAPRELYDSYMHAVERLFDCASARRRVHIIYGDGVFRPRSDSRRIPLRQRAAGAWAILICWVLSRDPQKRALLQTLFSLVRAKLLRADCAAAYLLSLEGARRVFAQWRAGRGELDRYLDDAPAHESSRESAAATGGRE
jgi:radical SAM superfamily enzyme YgiQ (UPF0313 family)